MSLNTAHANGGVLIFNGEIILLFCDGVELQIEGQDAKEFHGSKKGRLYLTTHRVIFTNKDVRDRLQSFSFPFFTMSSIELEQPIFGANYINGKVKAEPGGNWTGHAIFKLKFTTGGAIELGQAMLQAARLATRNMPAEPPPYAFAQGPFYPAAAPAYMPPPGCYYGFTPPTHVFGDTPPPNSVYTSDMPPPYPGLHPTPMYNGASPPQPGQPPFGKSQEAAQSAYYNPSNPSYAYMPAPNYASAPPPPNMDPQPPGQPPSYSEATKKSQ